MKTKLALAVFSTLAMMSSTANAEVKVSTKGGLKVSSGDFNFSVGGRIMYDYNKAEENGVTDEDGFNLRRGRIAIKGNIAKDWKFKSQFNTNGSGVEDLYLTYTGWGSGANVTVGNFIQPFGLEQITSSKDISVLERSAATEQYALGRQEGIKFHGKSGNSTYAASIFYDDVNDNEEGEETGFAARYTIAPIKSDSSVVHLGLAYRDIDDESALGFEAAATSGPFHIQAEYMDGEQGTDDISGYYVQAGYILTGESRPYKGGIFKRVKPKGNSGAWEVVARYEDGDANYSDIELGRTDATSYTLGVNWYAHKNIRFGVNYTDGEDNLSNDDGSEFRVRFQLTF
ncbi:outer membrane porin OprP [Arenicella sp. 4NH20-0111]|uniref:OprO/OprP family phosphate-selective porin n=1 Tax=Arenicella sp. 4NH20-0111 TaxID=3127648 RepID=UPI00310A7E6F